MIIKSFADDFEVALRLMYSCGFAGGSEEELRFNNCFLSLEDLAYLKASVKNYYLIIDGIEEIINENGFGINIKDKELFIEKFRDISNNISVKIDESYLACTKRDCELSFKYKKAIVDYITSLNHLVDKIKIKKVNVHNLSI